MSSNRQQRGKGKRPASGYAHKRGDRGAPLTRKPLDEQDSLLPERMPAVSDRPPLIQAEPTIGSPDDEYEREADRIAEQVMHTEGTTPEARVAEDELSRQPSEEEEEETLQAKPSTKQTPVVDPSMQSAIHSLEGGGHPLPPSERTFFEPRLGHDLSHVRVHTDQRAADLADHLKARALTSGRNIVFAAGHYAPWRVAGRKLLAHELVHVLQQSGRAARTVQRQPTGQKRRRKNLPTLNVAKTKQLFTDLNATLNKAFGPYGVTANLKLSDYDIKTPAQYVAFASTSSELSGEYTTAKTKANAVCTSKDPRASNRRYCRNRQPTALLISEFIETRGITAPTAGTALGTTTVIQEATQSKMLLLIVHEGLHRLRGKNWALRSKMGLGFYHSQSKQRLLPIRTWLDEGTVQILTNHIIAKMQAIPGKNWFKGFTSTAYQKHVTRVNALLTKNGKGIDFLAKAYFSPTSTREVEDLQSWQ